MLKIILLILVIYLLYSNRESFGDGICFGNCGCETEKMCAFHSERSAVPQVCSAPEGSPPSCTQAKFLESMMLKCRHKDEGCAHYMEPQLEDSYGFQVSKCGECQSEGYFAKEVSSPEPKMSYPQLPPIAPEVLPVGYFMPTALTYERVEPPRNFASAPPLDGLRYSGGETFAEKYLPALITERFFPTAFPSKVAVSPTLVVRAVRKRMPPPVARSNGHSEKMNQPHAVSRYDRHRS